MKGDSPNEVVLIGIRLRRPRNDLLGATSEEIVPALLPPRARASHGSCNVVLLIRHTVGRAASRRQHRES
jgi:hypothetical protein